jgi:tetratricopeptide (TPR) repeat protein
LRKLLAKLPTTGSGQPDAVAELAALIARHFLQQENFVEAEPIARLAYELRRKHSPDHWRVFYSQVLLGHALTGLKRYPEAEPHLRESLAKLDAQLAKLPSPARGARLQAIESLAEVLSATGRAEEAAEYRKRLPPPTP